MGQVQTGQQNAVDKAGKRAHRQAGDDQQRHAGDAEVLDQHADGAGAQHAVGTHGQVDAGGDQGAQHAGGDQAVDGSLLEDVHDIADPRELIGHHHAENENQQRQRHQGAELLQKLFSGILLFHISLILLPRPLS